MKMKYRPAFSVIRLAFFIVSFAFIWSLFLFFSPKFSNEIQIKESDRLKSQIIQLSKQYISSLAKEKGANEKGILIYFIVTILVILLLAQDNQTLHLKTLLIHHVFGKEGRSIICLLYTSPSPRDATLSRMPSSA